MLNDLQYKNRVSKNVHNLEASEKIVKIYSAVVWLLTLHVSINDIELATNVSKNKLTQTKFFWPLELIEDDIFKRIFSSQVLLLLLLIKAFNEVYEHSVYLQ